MKILITGSFGMLGQYLCDQLEKDNFKIFKTSRRNVSSKNFISIDFLNFNHDYQKKLEEFVTPDLIIHAGALTNVDECERDNKKADLINTISTKKLINIFKGIKIIYISTDAVFGDQKKRYENSEASPLNYYGKTKLRSENIVLKEKNSLVIRTTPVGLNQLNNSSFINWIYNNYKQNNELEVFDNIIFNPIHPTQLSKFISLLINSNSRGIWHINNNDRISKYKFVKKLLNELNWKKNKVIKTQYNYKMLLAKRSTNQVLYCNKFKKFFNKNMPSLNSTINIIKKDLIIYDK